MKKVIVTIIQAAVTLGLLYWLFRDPQKRAEMWEALKHAEKSWFFAGLLAYALVEILGAWRWHILLRVQDIRIKFWRVLQLFMIGVFFNLFMLGAVGGDVVKIFYLLKETSKQKATALLTVFMDRLVGLIALIVVSAIIVGPQYQIFLKSPTTKALLVSLALVLLGAIGGILFSFVITGFKLVHKLPKHLPLHDKLVEMSVAYNLYARAWRPTLAGLAISAVAHTANFMTFYFAARAFTDQISCMNILTVMPVVNTITALPISISGVGVREGLFEQLLGNLYGVSNEVAVLVSLTGFMVVVAWSAIGGLVYLFYRPSDHAKISEIESEVSTLEEKIAQQD